MELFKGYCCPKEEAKRWKNCAWHGKPGSCFDNHCDLGHQVQLTQSDYGLGESCAPRLERTRVFCCDPSDGESPFLPVPLDYLFPHPPTGDDVDTDFDIKVDNTWGDGHADTSDDEPNDSTFGFVVMASPEELQTSLDKRDGSHWELFNCNNPTDEEEQTVRMICTDLSDNSNCGKISLGHGVPGTILEMPKGCSNGRYVVAKDMVISSDQDLPSHIAKRSFDHKPVVYDLTFDYQWMRVPRDLGDTQLRVDYSNEVVSILSRVTAPNDLYWVINFSFSRAIGTALSIKRRVPSASDLWQIPVAVIKNGWKRNGVKMHISAALTGEIFTNDGLEAMLSTG